MNLNDDDLAALYVAGLLEPEDARALEKRAETNTELAAEITLLRGVLGLNTSEPVPAKPLSARRQSSTYSVISHATRLAACVAVVALVGGVGWAARQSEVNGLETTIQETQTQLSASQGEIRQLKRRLIETTDEGWFDATLWLQPPDWIREGGIKAERGHYRLLNRGYLVTREDIAHPQEVNLDWKWVQLGLLPQYADFLTVVLRTSGVPQRRSPYELEDGVAIRFVAWAGTVSIWRLGETPAKDVKTELGSLPMPADTWHRIRITDDGETISVYLTGPAIKPTKQEKPVLTARVQGPFEGKRIAVFNRELTANIPHESYIRNFAIEAKGKTLP